jgi:hypothetical protein
MSVYVLVHGGFYGGWGWSHVARLLRSAGHEAFTPRTLRFNYSRFMGMVFQRILFRVIQVINF